MPPNAQTSIHLQRFMAVPEGAGIKSLEIDSKKQVRRRRIFVQTDTGDVLGLELDRGDRVQSVKKKVQAALYIPTEQSNLLFGDQVLEGDLSEVRNNSPLLLTRGLHRSSSTPCISEACYSLKQKDGIQPFEIVGGHLCCSKVRRLIKECTKAIKNGVEPVPAAGGLGGAYYFRNRMGERIAIVKPTDEEPFAPNNPKGFVGRMLGQPGFHRSVRVGETGIREVAAYLLDHHNFARVPPTALVKATHTIFHVNVSSPGSLASGKAQPMAKIGSFQQYVHHDYDASEHGTSRFSVSAVHRIGILDVRIFNTDRHAGNILVRRLDADEMKDVHSLSSLQVDDPVDLIPIDHGLCLPEALEDPYFEWLHWPQASLPFSEEELDYIKNLDAAKDAELLQAMLPMLREACLRVLVLSTTFLQQAATAGLCLAEIGTMMTRDLCVVDEELSELEVACMLAKLEVDRDLSTYIADRKEILEDFHDEDEFSMVQFEMDQEDEQLNVSNSCNQNGVHNFFPFSPVGDLHLGDRQTYSSCHSPGRTRFDGNGLSWSSPGSSFTGLTRRESFTPLSMLKESPHSDDELLYNSAMNLFPQIPPKCFGEALPSMHSTSKIIDSKGKQDLCSGSLKLRRAASMRGFSTFEVAEKVRETEGSLVVPGFLDMGEREWGLFLDHFRNLLQVMFDEHKRKKLGCLQRLGTSCQF
eukprot:c28924_g2_i1 orf=423-2510(+)